MAKRKLVTAGKYTPAHLTDNEEFALLELEEKLKERKARKTQLSMYLPSVLDKVKAALIISMPMEEIKEKYGVPIRVIMSLQKKYNPKLRKTRHLKKYDKLYYADQMIKEGIPEEKIANFLDLSVKGFRYIWSERIIDIPLTPRKGMPKHWKEFPYSVAN
ncbi:TPA: hypothetical protein K8N54_004233 [Serratia marcescens]|uniref:Uncharacterized protein n=1 Tax=Serratia marcescens SM39 TaxID=1334564 RepID=A0AAT9DUN3_SERMA|nr:hypothetical protein [Serratia marcescens]BAO34139.1 hypothetical protein SM39_2120 [Serratia marcescens SM39]BCZ41479.1 hypothetical protein SMGES_28050 [Serratia marcescens]HBI6269425.1 hypothetical protein [Serratia marcescens]HBI6949640.1 hypothetical protein [Serratia marcescens]HBI6959900.1 hypothetical protein [Serratia marcescens]